MKPGIVAIGRNEGSRLDACLRSVADFLPRVVYVDSGSSDGSVALARRVGADVVELDLNTPFTAARARNAGFARLMELHPDLALVFFVDGDCEVESGWMSAASAFLAREASVAVVCGIRRERYPQQSLYNRLCDLEWHSAPFGSVKACGGDALFRVAAFRAAGGYNPSLICGEEPDLCVRLRMSGWLVWHLDQPMTIHDAAIHRFMQWWRRTRRAGYAYAQGAAMHGAAPERHWVAESRRAWIWGLVIPLIAITGACLDIRIGLLILLVYPLQCLRLALRAGAAADIRWRWAAATVVGKFAEMLGQVQYLVSRVRMTRQTLIEYK